ncbi:MAG TPA: sigma-70 family RNA polymerase sigma factor [Polyangiaceae bacterium]|nr:sigma-70 family RNA polymerase sigma factor [Polyangiaceae bacterium]
MDEAARARLERLESQVRAHCDARDWDAACTAILRGYGPEVFGFLVAVHRNEAAANDAFSDLAEAIWRSLPNFAWQSSVRTWTYAIARNVSRTRKRDAARLDRRAPRAGDSALEGVAAKVRTETLAILRTETKTRLQALRDALPEADRMLLVLRIDRGLSWNDLARVLHEGEEDAQLDDAALTREAARLRKRFQLVKDKLREMAKKEGLLD